MPFVNGIRRRASSIVARTDEDRADFLRKRGFSKAETAKIIETVLAEEGHPPASVFDFVQGITAVARDKPHQDARLELEGRPGSCWTGRPDSAVGERFRLRLSFPASQRCGAVASEEEGGPLRFVTGSRVEREAPGRPVTE